MNNLTIAKFIEREGLKIIIAVGVAVLAVSFWIFYVYGFGSIDIVSDLQANSSVLKQGLIDDVVKDMDSRESALIKLKQAPLTASDIFR
ncbi:MAG: hypothetical protein AAB911_00050 [Patescibacteria group bacterium]